MRALERKLLRDLWQIRGQAAAIAAVIAAGVALWVLLLSTFHSLDLTRDTYYRRYRFGDVFASCKRAPSRLESDIAAIPGVARARTRVVSDVTLDVQGLAEPAMARLISMPVPRRPVLDDVFVRAGRFLDEGASDEVLVSEGFANAHGLEPGDSLYAVINGVRRRLHIVGLALSPEFVYVIRPGELLPDDERYAVIWMERRELAAAFDMEGAFNDVVLSLEPEARTQAVIDRLDRILAPWGGTGAIPRRLQLSHFYLSSELDGLHAFGRFLPVIFLAVAAFLLNVVLHRIVTVQRQQIAAMKAVGYGDRSLSMHYVCWSLLITAVGVAAGIAVGAWLGSGMTAMYTDFFDFPILTYELPVGIVLQAVAVSVLAAVGGALAAVRRTVSMPPAEAMRPPVPAVFRPSLLERLGGGRWLDQPARIVLRTLRRHPGRAALSVIGIAAAGSLLVAGNFSMDAMDVMMALEFGQAERYDLAVTFVEPTSSSAAAELEQLPGVMAVEPFRSVPVRLRFGHRSRHTAITGLVPHPRLSRIVDASSRVRELPPAGLVLSAKLAEILGASPGDEVTVEVLEGRRPVERVPVVQVVREYMGTNAYMAEPAVHRLLDEGRTLSGAYLMVDRARQDVLYRQLKDTPRVAGVALKSAAIESFDRTMAEMLGMVRAVTVAFAVVIAFGVVYNSARISLSERQRELATLRVIGFTRGEISSILLGEFVLLAMAAVPLGLVGGYGLAAIMVRIYDTEVWRMPLVVAPATYAFAALVLMVATAGTALVLRRKLNRLDLVEVLKQRE